MSTHGGAESGRGGVVRPTPPVVLQPGERIAPVPFMDTYGNPHLQSCSCGCTSAGGRLCRLGRSIRAEQRKYDERLELLAVLTDEDKAWLAEHGWRP